MTHRTIDAYTRDRLTARHIIAACEQDLRRVLSQGERTDLLADNTSWSLDHCRVIAHELAGWQGL